MAKKPVSLEAAMRGEPQPEAAPAAAAPASSHSPQDVAPTIKPPTSEKLTVYVPRAAARRLKQMALDHDRRVNDFLQEGVDLMLAKYGQPSLAEFEKK